MKTKAQFIVIEGGDGAGKETQANLLRDAFQKEGMALSMFDFPRYGEFFGGIVGRALKGEFGDFVSLSPHLASMPFTLDRVSAKPDLLAALSSGHVLSNRYTPSNVAYQAAKIADAVERREFIASLEKGEYEILGLPKPTLVIYLKVPVEISAKLVTEKAARNYLGNEKGLADLHEKNLEFQKKVVDTYLALAKERPEWRVIDCAPEGKMLSREAIHAQVLGIVRATLIR